MRIFNLVRGMAVVIVLVCAAQQARAIQFQSNLVMHFDAANVETSGSNVTKWLNTGTGGSAADATPVAASPLSVSNVINGQPVVQFDRATTQILRTGALGSDISQPLTIFHIGMMTDTSTSAEGAGVPFYYDGRVNGKRAAFYHANAASDSIYGGAGPMSGTGATANVFNSWASIFNGNNSYINRNGSDVAGPGNAGTNPLDGLSIGGRYNSVNRMSGDIAEIAVYAGLLNAAELKIASNHFSAKYELPVETNLYDGDNNGAGGYDMNVFGIGNSGAITGFAAGTVTTGTEGRGLTINSTGSLDENDFVLAGDRGLANGTTTLGTPILTTRWERVWNLDQTGQSDVDLVFNTVDAGLGSASLDAKYELLYSATDSLDFSVYSTNFSLLGDEITFSVLGANLSDGFYTLGIEYSVPEPSSFGLLGMMLCGALTLRKRTRPAVK